MIVASLGIWWAWNVGDFLQGEHFIYPTLIAAGIPLLCLWVGLGILRALRVVDKSHFRFVLVTSLALLLLAYQPWTPRAKFVRTLYSIQPGMTEQEVRERMGPYTRYRGGPKTVGNPLVMDEPEWPSSFSGSLYFRWNETDSRYDFDLGEVVFEDGLVVSRRFLPD